LVDKKKKPEGRKSRASVSLMILTFVIPIWGGAGTEQADQREEAPQGQAKPTQPTSCLEQQRPQVYTIAN
jgi:hypothetical protein